MYFHLIVKHNRSILWSGPFIIQPQSFPTLDSSTYQGKPNQLVAAPDQTGRKGPHILLHAACLDASQIMSQCHGILLPLGGSMKYISLHLFYQKTLTLEISFASVSWPIQTGSSSISYYTTAYTEYIPYNMHTKWSYSMNTLQRQKQKVYMKTKEHTAKCFCLKIVNNCFEFV